ncbi:hypothetical protein BSKO_05613 [Bryopsis sp. KO-2023]|nr:hypothetical protein BSKO_05613 [Bryopsis sp. KO-2023]
MDGNQGDSRASRIPPSQQGSSSRASSPSASLAAISEQSALMTTEEFSDIAHHASETAKAILGDIGGSGAPSRVRTNQRSPPPSPAGGGSRKYLTPKWRAGSRVNSIGLLDMDEESVFTVGSYEGDVLGMSMSLDEADIFRLSGWNRRRLEDIQSVGSREEGEEGGPSSQQPPQQQQEQSPGPSLKSNLRPLENESWSSFEGSSEDNNDRDGNAGGRNRGRVAGEESASQQPGEKDEGESDRQGLRLGVPMERRGDAEQPGDVLDEEGSDVVNRGSDESLSHSFGGEGWEGSLGEAEVGGLNLDTSSSNREGVLRGDSFNFNSASPTPTAAHVEMASVVKLAEGEVAELRRQVHQKNAQLDMAQAALLEYEDEIQKLYKRVRETGRSSRRHGSQELVLTELAKVKSETSSLASQINRSISFNSRLGGAEAAEIEKDEGVLLELETLRSQNAVLTTQLQNRVAREQLDQLEKEVSAVHANRDALEEELSLLRDDKSRLQSQLLEAQEEAISILNETHDADEEVQVYMRRLVECQNQRDTLERNLHRTEADLSNLQKENMQLKAEARAWKARSGDVGQILSVNEMNVQMEKMVAELDGVVAENHGLRGELEALRLGAAEAENSRAADSEKIKELRKALAVAIEVNNCLKEQVEELDGGGDSDSESERRFEESLANHKLQQMQEALHLALEAKNLLEERVTENEEVSAGLKFLQSEVMGLEVDLHGEQQEMQEKYGALLESKQECVQQLSQVREALGLALQAKTELESRLDREAQVVQELRSRIDELERRLGDGRLPVRSKLDVARSTSVAGSAETQIGVAVAEMEYVDSPIGPGGSIGELGGFSRPGQVQGSRLEEVEKQLQDALQEKSKLLDRLSGISTATAELEKVMKEDVKAPSHSEHMGVASLAAVQEPGGGLGRARSGDNEEDESGSRSLSNSKGPSSGNRSRTVTIYTHQLRNLRREIRELTAENKKLQDECDANKGREDAFYVELEKLQEELAGALQHKESLASQFREFGHVRKRLVSEIDSLKRTLDEERMKSVMAEEAVDDFRALHMDMLRIMGSGSQIDDIADVPMQLPDSIRYWAKKIREDMVSLVSNPSMLPPPPSPVRSGRESPHAGDVVVSAQAHAEFDEPLPSPSRHSNVDSRSQMTVLKNDFRDLRVDDGYDHTDDSPSPKQQHDLLAGDLTLNPIGHEGGNEYPIDEWEDDREGIYGSYDAEEEVSGRHHHQHRELPPSLQGILDLSNIPEELVTVTETEEEVEEEGPQQEGKATVVVEEEDKDRHQERQTVLQGTMNLRSAPPLTPREAHHHTDSVGISMTETDESPRISEDRNPGHESEPQQDPVASRISFQDVLDNLEGEIEMLRQEKNRLSPTEDDPTDDDAQQLTRELSQRIVELQGWADEIEAALVTKSEDLDADISDYPNQVSWVEG